MEINQSLKKFKISKESISNNCGIFFSEMGTFCFYGMRYACGFMVSHLAV
jgi:hypothetical protein